MQQWAIANMRFTTAAIAVAILAKSANLGEGRQQIMDKNFPKERKREALQLLLVNAKPMWEQMKDPPADLHVSLWEDRECYLDVGILECGVDEVCVESTGSKRGGICLSSKITEDVSRDLQSNETLFPTMIDVPTNYTKLCTEIQFYNCSCADLDLLTYDGKISCTNSTWCVDDNRTDCGIAFYSYYIENKTVTAYAACYEVMQERFCNFVDAADYSCAATMNGCDCSCEINLISCNSSFTGSMFMITCPNNVTTDPCDDQGFESLLGDKVASCELTGAPTTLSPTTSPTQSPTTMGPSKVPVLAPVVMETEVPSTSPLIQPPVITTSSSTRNPKWFQRAYAVTAVTVFAIVFV
jgi:hypothetical protein